MKDACDRTCGFCQPVATCDDEGKTGSSLVLEITVGSDTTNMLQLFLDIARLLHVDLSCVEAKVENQNSRRVLSDTPTPTQNEHQQTMTMFKVIVTLPQSARLDLESRMDQFQGLKYVTHFSWRLAEHPEDLRQNVDEEIQKIVNGSHNSSSSKGSGANLVQAAVLSIDVVPVAASAGCVAFLGLLLLCWRFRLLRCRGFCKPRDTAAVPESGTEGQSKTSPKNYPEQIHKPSHWDEELGNSSSACNLCDVRINGLDGDSNEEDTLELVASSSSTAAPTEPSISSATEDAIPGPQVEAVFSKSSSTSYNTEPKKSGLVSAEQNPEVCRNSESTAGSTEPWLANAMDKLKASQSSKPTVGSKSNVISNSVSTKSWPTNAVGSQKNADAAVPSMGSAHDATKSDVQDVMHNGTDTLSSKDKAYVRREFSIGKDLGIMTARYKRRRSKPMDGSRSLEVTSRSSEPKGGSTDSWLGSAEENMKIIRNTESTACPSEPCLTSTEQSPKVTQSSESMVGSTKPNAKENPNDIRNSESTAGSTEPCLAHTKENTKSSESTVGSELAVPMVVPQPCLASDEQNPNVSRNSVSTESWPTNADGSQKNADTAIPSMGSEHDSTQSEVQDVVHNVTENSPTKDTIPKDTIPKDKTYPQRKLSIGKDLGKMSTRSKRTSSESTGGSTEPWLVSAEGNPKSTKSSGSTDVSVDRSTRAKKVSSMGSVHAASAEVQRATGRKRSLRSQKPSGNVQKLCQVFETP